MTKWLRGLLVVVAASGVLLALPGDADAKGKGKGKAATAATVDAKFNRWIVTPHGKIGGLLLDNGAVVRMHHESVRDTSLKSGDALHVDGKTKGASVYHHAKITKGTAVVVDDTVKVAKGKSAKGGSKLSDMTASSKVSTLLTGHKGKLHAVILDDGTVAYAPHHGDLSTFSLKKGDAVTVTGKGGNYALGRALVITTLKLPNGDVKTL